MWDPHSLESVGYTKNKSRGSIALEFSDRQWVMSALTSTAFYLGVPGPYFLLFKVPGTGLLKALEFPKW